MQGLLDEIADRLADVYRLIEGDAELHVGRNANHFRQRRTQGIDYFHGICDRLLIDAKVDRPFAVCSNDVRLDVGRIGHSAQVPDPNRVSLLVHFDNDILNRLNGAELVIGEDVVVEIAGLDIARREDQIRGFDRLHNIQDRQPTRIEQCRIQINVDLADLAAFHGGGGDVGNLFNLGSDRIERKVIQRPFVQGVAGDSDEGHRNIRDVELDDKRLKYTRRQAVQDLGNPLHDLHLSDVDVRTPVEPDLNGADALLGERFDMLHIGRRADGFLDGIH